MDEEWRAFFRERLGEAAPAPLPPRVPERPAAPTAPAAAPAPAAARAPRAGETPEPLRGAALRVAENMEASLGVPTATSQRQIPVKLLEENRRLINDHRASRDESKISFTHLIAWAILQALKDFPRLNDAYDDSGDTPVRLRRDKINFGLAVDVEKKDGSRSLVVPNVKDAGAMNLAQFVAASDDVVSRARAGKLEVSDFEGTTLSLTNPGTLGTTASVPRLMPGQGLIVATGAMEYPGEFRAMAPEAISQLAIGRVVTFTSTYDHRVIQGAESGAFLGRIEELLLGGHDFYDKAFSDLSISQQPLHWAVDRNPAVSGDARTGEIEKQARVLELINAYRVRGHLIADIDPLGLMAVPRHPELDLDTYGLTIWDLDRTFWSGGLAGGDHMPLRQIIAVMRRVYCGRIGVEYRHISSPTEKYWVRKQMAAATQAEPLPADLRKAILARLVAAESFEKFLGTRFLGQRRYSIEGCETAIAVLDQLVEGAASRGVDEITMGVTHRGRLNILANVVGNSTERLFAAFEGTVHPDFPADEGDVKYHQGARAKRSTQSGREIAITVPSNPSHLEAVDPVVEGRARAKQDHTRLPRSESWGKVLPVILHGDAAFAGQGIVAEVFNLSQLIGFRTGGTIHIVINNQIGFTTDPKAGRSSLYSTDVAKIVQIPIFHVNADDPEAAYRVLQIALDYRNEFHKDVVIDLIGFRRHGHQETDEPTYTQPLMYKRIEEHPGVRALYARRLVKEGVLTQPEFEELESRQMSAYDAALASAKTKGEEAGPPTAQHPGESGRVEEVATGVPRETLARIGRVLTTVPPGFNLNPKMVQQLARRAKMTEGAQPLDWATAEALAFGSLSAGRHPNKNVRPGQRPRYFFAAPRSLHRHPDRQEVDPPLRPRRQPGLLPNLRQPPLRERRPGLRIRLQRRIPRSPRDLGSPIRRLRQRRPGNPRPVRHLGRRQVARNNPPDPLPPPRLRRPGPRTLQRQNRALPPALRRRKPPSLQRDDSGAILPRPPPPTSSQVRETPGPLHPQEPPPLSCVFLIAGRAHVGRLPVPARRQGSLRQTHDRARDALGRKGLLRPASRARGEEGCENGSPALGAVLSLSGRRTPRSPGSPSIAPRGRVGPGGAAEHGRLDLRPTAPLGDPPGGRPAPLRWSSPLRLSRDGQRQRAQAGTGGLARRRLRK